MKILAASFAEDNKFSCEKAAKFLLEVDRLKSCGKYSDDQILVYAYQSIINSEISYGHPSDIESGF